MTRGTRGRFREVVLDYATRIRQGLLPPGTLLPSERSLAARLQMNRSTVAAAYAELEAAGLVERCQGKGTVVRGDLWGVAPDWPGYITGGSFEPSRPLLQQLRSARGAPGVIDLSEGVVSPDLAPTGVMQRLLSSGLELPDLGYPDPRGSSRLRMAVADMLERKRGIPATAGSLLITSGAQQALYLIIRALLRPGDAIAVEQPSYFYSLSLFSSAGIRLLPLPVDQDGVKPEVIRRLYGEHRIRMVLVTPTFQNPTGAILSAPRRHDLLAICRSLNLPVVEDDSYGHLGFSAATPPALKASDQEGRVIYVGSLSKMGAPGLRVGWVLGPEPVVERLADVKQQMDFGCSTLVQGVTAALLASTDWEGHQNGLREGLMVRRDALMAALGESFGGEMEVSTPAGGLHLWARWSGPGHDLRRLESAFRHGVLIAPGRLYGVGDGWLRLTFAREGTPQIQEAVRRLRRGWSHIPDSDEGAVVRANSHTPRTAKRSVPVSPGSPPNNG